MDIEIILVNSDTEYEEAKRLFIDYQKELDVDLCFQSFNEELEKLPQHYGSPDGGLILLRQANHYFACAGVRKISPHICELKRMYVEPAFRGQGHSKTILAEIFNIARALKYQKMQLDTLPKLKAAIHLYQRNGFNEISAYYPNPIEGVQYFEKDLLN